MSEQSAGEPTPNDAVVNDTTSIALPVFNDPVVADHKLTDQERQWLNSLAPDSALLIAHRGPNTGARFLLDQDVVGAGRRPDSDIFLDDVTVSRKHVQFVRNENGYQLIDQGSLNGTYVNQDRVDSIQLRSGQEVQIGKFRLTYYAAGRY